MQQRERKTPFAHLLQFIHTDSLSLSLTYIKNNTSNEKLKLKWTSAVWMFVCSMPVRAGAFQKRSYLKTLKEYTVTHEPTDTSPTKT